LTVTSDTEKLDRKQRRERLRQNLLKLIEQNSEGERLPSERELSETLGVARETLRHALDALAKEGLLNRKQGAGTFVSGKAWVKRFQLISFSEDMQQRGLRPSSRLLSTTLIAASPKLAQKLKVAPGVSVHEIKRLRLADDAPMALETAYLASARVPDLDPSQLSTRSLYEMLESGYAIYLKSAMQRIHATVLDEAEAALLEVMPYSPALLVTRQVTSSTGEIIEYGKSLYRADRYRFEVNVMRPITSRTTKAKN
jgi:GntR family transcriptional regulator